jgi:uncharacterized protein (TIGR03067 family)
MRPPGGFKPPEGIGPPGGFRPPGTGGPGAGEGKEEEKNDGTIKVTREDEVVVCALELTLNNKAYGMISTFVNEGVVMLKSQADLASRRVRIHDLAAAMQSYVKATGAFPQGALPRSAGGLPAAPDRRLAWTAALLPHLGEEYRAWKVFANQSWDEGANLLVAHRVVPHFLMPSAPEAGSMLIAYPGKGEWLFGATHFVGVSGLGLDAAEYVPGNSETDKKRGVFGWDRVTRLAEIKNPDKTIVLLLVRGEHKAPWLAGGGATVRAVSDDDEDGKPIAPFVCTTFPSKPGVESKFDGKRGTIAIMADGKVRFIPEDLPTATFRALCTIAPKKIDKFDEVCPVLENPDDRELKADGAKVGLPGVPDGVAKGSDQEKIQGMWAPVSVAKNGVNMPPALLKGLRLTISGNTLTLTGGGPSQRASFTIDSSKSPKHFDSVDLDGPNRGKKQLGIYELTEKQFKICMGVEGGTARPTAFASTLDNKQTLIVLERATAAPSAPSKLGAWKEFTPPTKAFTVKMPGEVAEIKQTVNLPSGKLDLVIYFAGELTSGFVVTTTDYPAGFVAKTGLEAVMQGARTGVTATLPKGSKITAETAIKLGTHPGRDWLIDIPGHGKLQVKFYLVGDRAFRLNAGPMPPVKDADAKTFFDSFKLTK